MKSLQIISFLNVLVVISSCFTVGAQSRVNKTGDYLPEMSIEKLHIESKNIHLTLSELASRYNIPIGLEVASEDDLLNASNISLNLEATTLKDVLNSIVSQNTLYNWKIIDSVVNVFPKRSNRDLALQKLLETRIETFSVREGTSRYNFRDFLIKKEELRTVLENENLVPEVAVFSSRDIKPLGRAFSLSVSDISLKDLLNRTVRESETKYWIVSRTGENKQYFLLNL